MVEAGTLMRFIRILSELSGQIRYSTQKRVLVEVALIKLCKPQMETDTASLLERIRALEKKVQEGVVVQQAPVKSASAAQTAPEEKTAQAPQEKATPEDLKAVAQNWSKIVLKSGRLLRAVLENSVPKYNAQTGDNILYLAVNTPNNGFGLSERNLMELQDIIQETIHKSVEIQEVTMKNDGPSLRDLEIEQTLSREIDFPVCKGENMAKRGGFPGGMGMPGNMNNLMKQAQKMQKQMEESQKALEEKSYTAAAGGGAVEVTISGKKEVTAVKLAEEVVDPDDIEMLQDLIIAAVNEALRKADADSAAMMSKLTGGLGGGFPF